MSAGFPIAAATLALADRLQLLIGDAVPGARVTMFNPSSEALRDGSPTVNLYLFRVLRSEFVSNDLPTRDARGRPLASPTLPLNLDYMVTFFGDDVRLDAQRLLGLVAGGLYADPYLGPEALLRAVASTPWLGGVQDADLAADRLRVVPINMPPDAMARLWSEFVNVPYELTMLYTMSTVALRTALPVAPVIPVRRATVNAHPADGLRIQSIVNAADPSLPLVAGGQMGVRLADPNRPGLVVNLNDAPATGVQPASDAHGFPILRVPLTADQPGPLAVGPLTVAVVQTGPGGAGIRARSSPVQAAVLPAFAEPPTVLDGRVTSTLMLPISPRSRAALLLFPRGEPDLQARRIPGLPRDEPTATLAAPLGGVPAGHYLVIAEVDGFATLPDFEAGAYRGPYVDVPAAG